MAVVDPAIGRPANTAVRRRGRCHYTDWWVQTRLAVVVTHSLSCKEGVRYTRTKLSSKYYNITIIVRWLRTVLVLSFIGGKRVVCSIVILLCIEGGGCPSMMKIPAKPYVVLFVCRQKHAYIYMSYIRRVDPINCLPRRRDGALFTSTPSSMRVR